MNKTLTVKVDANEATIKVAKAMIEAGEKMINDIEEKNKEKFSVIDNNMYVDYFGMRVKVEKDDKYIATNERGSIYAYTLKPEQRSHCWEGNGGILMWLATTEYKGSWKDSLLEITHQQRENTL